MLIKEQQSKIYEKVKTSSWDIRDVRRHLFCYAINADSSWVQMSFLSKTNKDITDDKVAYYKQSNNMNSCEQNQKHQDIQ